MHEERFSPVPNVSDPQIGSKLLSIQPTSVRSRILILEAADKLEELLRPALLEYTHERASQCLSRSIRYFRHCSPRSAALLNVAACNLLELQVSCHIGRDEDVCEFAVRHEELRDEIDVPVVGAAILLPWLLAFCVVAIFLEKL